MNKKKSIFIVLILIFLIASCGLIYFQYILSQDYFTKNRKTINYATDLLKESNIPHFSLDKVFVINLDRTPERWIQTKNILLQNALQADEIERFSATDGALIQITRSDNNETFIGKDLILKNKRIVKNKIYKIKCNDKISFQYKWTDAKAALGAGEMGIFCSTLRLAKEVLDRKYQNVLIFEDDIIDLEWKKNTNFNLKNYLKEDGNFIQKNCDAVFLYTLMEKRKKKIIKDYFSKNKISTFKSSDYNFFCVNAAYVINNQFAGILLDYIENNVIEQPVDGLYSSKLTNNKLFNTRFCYYNKFLFDHPTNDLNSTIQKMGRDF